MSETRIVEECAAPREAPAAAPLPRPTEPPAPAPLAKRDRSTLGREFERVRARTLAIVEPLEVEDFVLQSMTEASPARWHLAHTSWFFETFVLLAERPSEPPFDARFEELFNSYYESVGRPFPRERRGLLSRPTVGEILRYRAHVDERVADFLRECDAATLARVAPVLQLGLHHEQQHQELILTDLLHAFAQNPLAPVYRETPPADEAREPDLRWVPFSAGAREIGHAGPQFAYDNEGPRHTTWCRDFELASRPVTNREYLEFVRDGGYRRVELWLSEGFGRVQREAWRAPLYWREREGRWVEFGLGGERALALAEPVRHISYFEADAYARWAGARLPTEAEWEVAAAAAVGSDARRGEGSGTAALDGNFLEDESLRPRVARDREGPTQLFGDVWEWTSSAYAPYPGYRASADALGEYNGKFMCNQYVLRGGSCLTPRGHVRASYRNFFPTDARWQMAGVRLAR